MAVRILTAKVKMIIIIYLQDRLTMNTKTSRINMQRPVRKKILFNSSRIYSEESYEIPTDIPSGKAAVIWSISSRTVLTAESRFELSVTVIDILMVFRPLTL